MQTALGELFDHGLDAIQITIQAYIMCCTMQLGATVWTYIVVIALYITGYILIWEDYCTNELRFGEYNSPTEAMVIVLVMLLSVACFGNSFWVNTSYTGELVGINWLALNHLFVYAGLLLAVSATVPTVMYVVQKAKEGKNDRLKRIGGVNGSLSSLFPSFFVVINYCGYLWVSEELYSVYPKTYLVALGCVSWYIQVCSY
jgi:ethanolaminephosphotransferase